MTPRRREALQGLILERIVALHPGTLDREIAAVAGVGRPQVSHFRDGSRKLDIDELVALQAAYGAEAVLGALVDLDGADVVPREAPSGGDLVQTSVRAVLRVAELNAYMHIATGDKRIDLDELEGIVSRGEAAVADLRLLVAQARRMAS